jgi:hypothetical protein
MARKITSSLAVEGELTDKGLATLVETSETITVELARMLVETAGSSSPGALKNSWAEYRRMEMHVQSSLQKPSTSDHRQDATSASAAKNLRAQVSENVMVDFIELTSRRKPKVTRPNSGMWCG